MKYDDCTCLSSKEILSLVDDYYKVNSFLVDGNALIYENVIISKSVHLCMTRFDGEKSIARDRREVGREGNLIYTRGRSGRQAQNGRRSSSGTTDQVKISSDSVRTDISYGFETDVVSTYELQIRQISTCWKDNFIYFPTSRPSYTGSSRTSRADRNK
jgi:hypothetical protein